MNPHEMQRQGRLKINHCIMWLLLDCIHIIFMVVKWKMVWFVPITECYQVEKKKEAGIIQTQVTQSVAMPIILTLLVIHSIMLT